MRYGSSTDDMILDYSAENRREIESQADKHVVYLVRLHLDSQADK